MLSDTPTSLLSGIAKLGVAVTSIVSVDPVTGVGDVSTPTKA